MKGVELPTTLLVGIIIAVIIVVVALAILSIITGPEESKIYEGYFWSCCTAYSIGGHCEEGAGNYSFECLVSSDLAPGGKMTISELGSKIGVSVERCCG